MNDDTVHLDTVFDLLAQRVDFSKQFRNACRIAACRRICRENFMQLAQGNDSEHIGCDRVAEGTAVVAGTEARPGHAGIVDGIAAAVVVERIDPAAVGALEVVCGFGHVVLLGDPQIDDRFDGCNEGQIEDGVVAACLPVQIRKSDRIAQRVDLVLALPDPVIADRTVVDIVMTDRL